MCSQRRFFVERTCSAHPTVSGRSFKRHLSNTREINASEGTSTVDATPQTKRLKVPHVLVYALGNYPYPLSRHSLPQSVLPDILQRYGLSTARATMPNNGNARSATGSFGNALTLMKKHDCWIGGGLIDIGSSRRPHRRTPQPAEMKDSSRRAVVSLVKPRKSPSSFSNLRLAFKLTRHRSLDEHRRSASPIPTTIGPRATPYIQR